METIWNDFCANKDNVHPIDTNIEPSLEVNVKKEYLTMIEEIHLILSNIKNLTNKQKLDYCNSERFFMKLYLNKVISEIKK